MGSTPRGISASRGAAILGLSEYQSPFQVWQLIMEEREPGFNAAHGFVLPPPPDSAAIRWGTAFEDAVVDLAQGSVGREIIDREGEYDFPDAYFVTCHIDGAYKCDGPEHSALLHEGKTTSAMAYRAKWGTPGTDRIPQSYAIQVQHQMACTGANDCIVSVLVFPETQDKFEEMGLMLGKIKHGLGSEEWCISRKDGEEWKYLSSCMDWANVIGQMGYFHQYPVHANRDAQKLLIEGYTDFWNRHVIPGIPPEITDYRDIIRAFPEPKGTIVVDAERARLFAEYSAINSEIGKGGSLSKRLDQIKTMMIDYARKTDAMVDDESREATIFRDEAGNKLASFSRDKRGVYTFRVS